MSFTLQLLQETPLPGRQEAEYVPKPG